MRWKPASEQTSSRRGECGDSSDQGDSQIVEVEGGWLEKERVVVVVVDVVVAVRRRAGG